MALTRWLPPTHRPTVAGNQDRVTWLELFFDLVYVAALIQLGDQLSGDVTWSGVGRFVGVFTLLWWTWTLTTAYTNRFAVDDIVHRLLVFIQMFAVANVALLAVGPNENRWAWLALAYVAARVPLLIMYARTLSVGGDTAALARTYITAFSVGAALFAVSVPLDDSLRFVVWGVAIAIEFVAPVLATAKLAGPPLHDHHLGERYAIFTIIVFGETFVKTLTELAGRGISVETQIFGGLVSVAAVALWWTYYDDVAESHVRHSSRWFRVGWIYSHLPLAAALTAFGVGSKKIVDIESFGDTINQSYLWLFGGSVAVAMVATAVLDMLTVSPHFAVSSKLRVGAPVVAAATILAVVSIMDGPALLVVAILAAIVTVQIAVEVLIAAKADKIIEARIERDLARADRGCVDLADTIPLAAPVDAVCIACLEKDAQWVELRHCQRCGHIGCCDDSPGRHARAHWYSTGHMVITTIEPGGEWAYCFEHDAVDDPWSARTPAGS